MVCIYSGSISPMRIQIFLLLLTLVCLVAPIHSETLQKTNEDPNLTVSTDFGERVLEFDFPSFEVGIAEYPEGPTGVTVLHFPRGARMSLDVRGGSPGVVGDYGFVHAISLAGGSLLGLEAASGVSAGLLAKNGFVATWETIPLVSGGIVFDFGGRNNSIYPDKRLGRIALEHTQANRFPLGARGAGMSVTVGKGLDFDRGEQSGQGAAFLEIGELKVFACTVVNAIGAIYDRSGKVVRGHKNPRSGERMSFVDDIKLRVKAAQLLEAPKGNTTITVVVINAIGVNLRQLGRQIHSSMAQAIRPFHTDSDGDALWMVTTSEVELDQWSLTAIGAVASEVLWDAILTAHP